MSTTTKTWILNKKPSKDIDQDTFKLVEQDVPELKDGQIKVKTLYLSNDPAQ